MLLFHLLLRDIGRLNDIAVVIHKFITLINLHLGLGKCTRSNGRYVLNTIMGTLLIYKKRISLISMLELNRGSEEYIF